MQTTNQSIGECPFCGDEMIVFRTRQKKRIAKCINEACPKGFIYPLPSRGTIEITGILCPKDNYSILAIIPNLKIKSGKFKAQTNQTYFWANGPCFSCSQQNSCEFLNEAKEDYDIFEEKQ